MEDRTYRVMAEPADVPRRFRVEMGEAGRRLDLFLAERLKLSRAQARRLLARGAVRVDGGRASESRKGVGLAAGTEVEVAPFRRPREARASAEADAPLVVLADGPGWLAIDKRAGEPVHPLHEDEGGTVLGAALARHPEIQGVGEGGLRSGVVHRLDVETSGVLLLATAEDSWHRLRQAFAEHRIDKRYRALVAGPIEPRGSISLGLVVARHRPARVRVVPESERARARGVRDVEMSWRLLETRGAVSLVEVRPVTGFLHQIRAVMAHLGHPLLGDRTYAPPGIARAAARHMLHASQIRFEEVSAESAEPADFLSAFEAA
ncbi:MAG: RluA family pseudouridine synthase [bacterium]|jgi:23S rRNA pseudouridine1911/1915/1917 synthase|nr:RluA family pseudouridine synthase [bacterium]MDP6073966.1 RluA family pseudouridine synthase [Myxococcota bacterium]MDP6241849.1 RluA family pseudouridine synthase [Myxococcota bacterium]MDP7076563.1 RluA family pseudouridine synthase [Myxococcota bacterium]MDP7298354.1 RluA family pseudouridine synthase [Myxococcota bacterium]